MAANKTGPNVPALHGARSRVSDQRPVAVAPPRLIADFETRIGLMEFQFDTCGLRPLVELISHKKGAENARDGGTEHFQMAKPSMRARLNIDQIV